MTALAPQDPRHGTKRGHVAGCRETCCRQANARYQNLWRMGRANSTVDGTGTRRRVQAMQVMGWSAADIAEAGGWPSLYAVRVLLRNGRIEAQVWKSTAARARRAYRKLAMTPGPSGQTATRAKAKGWEGPLAWDDIDNPTEKPYRPRARIQASTDVDEVLVQRGINGHKVYANKAERRLIIDGWRKAGRTIKELDRVQGWNAQRDLRESA